MLYSNKSKIHSIRRGLIVTSVLLLIPCFSSQALADKDSSRHKSQSSGTDVTTNAVTVSDAVWLSDRSALFVRGGGASSNGIVNILYGNSGDNGASLGTIRADNGGNWLFRSTNPSPVPCHITAQFDGAEADFTVRRAPGDCSDNGNSSSNNVAPRLFPVGDKSVIAGTDLVFSVLSRDDGLPNGTLTLTAQNLPGDAIFVDNGDGVGRFIWRSASPAGMTDTTFTVSDGSLEATETITITVVDNNPPAQCDDGIDNDGDGLIDLADPGCTDANDNDETDPPPVAQCDDGIDNDGDGLIDLADPGCTDANDNDETDPLPPLTGNFTILAANDLGMHCADQDFRVFSILPPYNVMNAQVLKKGAKPQKMSPADGVQVTYQAAASNYFADLTDPTRLPDLTNSITSTGDNLPGVFKTNFWETAPASATGIDKIGYKAYESLYPPGILSMFSSLPDVGLPAPNVEHYYLLSNPRELLAEQSEMPGVLTNEPQPFHGYVENYPFFIDFPFGYTVNNFKRYTAEGIPLSSIDDDGRSNPYPLLRIEARDQANNVLASVDAVAPVASEADCAICHASQTVCDFQTNPLTCDNLPGFNYPNVNFIDDASLVIGDTPEQQVINTAKSNILRLHDAKHGTQLAGTEADGRNADGSTPDVVCASCHYSPALDLAHLGPNDENGKEQTQHISMSRAMHGVHGALTTNPDYASLNLFPMMPPPGANRDPAEAKSILMETCYNCHPGKRAECLRGAMGGSGTVCQDCHGQLTQVGDDFTEGFPAAGFPDGADLTKRVSWASEPHCDSCHVGDVNQVAQLQQDGSLNDTVVNAQDVHGNNDGLRLLMTYNLANHKANNGPDNLPILKFPDSRFATTEALYRLSGSNPGTNQGHEGLSCEGCHGSTHAIWPNANPNANDNKAANDIQGHSGPIIECSSCHEGDLGNTLDGPHGMHPVGDTSFSHGGHKDMADRNKDSCRACHGSNGQGTVLSRVAIDRVLRSEHGTVSLSKGEMVTCSLCHDNEL